jgi:hypothetical protein
MRRLLAPINNRVKYSFMGLRITYSSPRRGEAGRGVLPYDLPLPNPPPLGEEAKAGAGKNYPGGSFILFILNIPAKITFDAFTKLTMAKQKFRPTRLGGFSGAKAYIRYVEVLKKRRNAVGRTFCDASFA